MDRQDVIDSVIRLARVEQASPADVRGQLRPVRERLEDSLGRTARPAEAARVLGVTPPALKRWLDRGDIASVRTPDGRREIPLTELIELSEEVERARLEGRERALAAVIRDRRMRATESIDVDRVLPRRRPRTHRRPELQSLAYHRFVSERLTPALVEDARARLERWERTGRLDPRWATEWRKVLDRSIREIRKAISSDSPRARQLRQTSPFAGVLTEQERRRLIESVDARG